MPVSKRPRRKSSKPATPKLACPKAAMPDRRAVEGSMFSTLKPKAENAVAAAQSVSFLKTPSAHSDDAIPQELDAL